MPRQTVSPIVPAPWEPLYIKDMFPHSGEHTSASWSRLALVAKAETRLARGDMENRPHLDRQHTGQSAARVVCLNG
jgi:hypothetical protein